VSCKAGYHQWSIKGAPHQQLNVQCSSGHELSSSLIHLVASLLANEKLQNRKRELPWLKGMGYCCSTRQCVERAKHQILTHVFLNQSQLFLQNGAFSISTTKTIATIFVNETLFADLATNSVAMSTGASCWVFTAISPQHNFLLPLFHKNHPARHLRNRGRELAFRKIVGCDY